MIVVNFFGGPGVGKSTLSTRVFSDLKRHGVNAEYSSEFAKDKTWEAHPKVLRCQQYVFGKQYWKLFRLKGEVDVVVTDSPVFLSAVYGESLGKTWVRAFAEGFNDFDNVNFLLVRDSENHPYNPRGRNQTEEQAREVDGLVRAALVREQIEFFEVDVSDWDKAIASIHAVLQRKGVYKPKEPLQQDLGMF